MCLSVAILFKLHVAPNVKPPWFKRLCRWELRRELRRVLDSVVERRVVPTVDDVDVGFVRDEELDDVDDALAGGEV